MEIRAELESDHAEVFTVNQLAFDQDDESRIIEKIRESPHFVPELSLVAINNNELIGHILFSRLQINGAQEHTSLALAPMAVRPDHQKQGVGGKLIAEGFKRALQLGFDSVIVLGHKDYYPRFGFKRASTWNIKCPFNVPDNAFMAIELKPNALKDKRGTVRYADALME